jgi:hypothetical protein
VGFSGNIGIIVNGFHSLQSSKQAKCQKTNDRKPAPEEFAPAIDTPLTDAYIFPWFRIRADVVITFR